MSKLVGLQSSNGKEIEVTTCRTRAESSRAVLKWDIQDFDIHVLNETEMEIPQADKDAFFLAFKPLRSPVFKTTLGQTETRKSEQEWFVEMNVKIPKSETDTPNVERYVSFFLNYQPSDSCMVEPLRLVASFCVIGENTTEFLSHTFGATYAKLKSGDWGFPKFVPLKFLWENRKTHLVNNTLRVKVEVTVFGSALAEITDYGSFECPLSSGSKQLADDMKQLFKSGKDADITISCCGKDFPVHSAILKGRSSVFDRMLESDMKESKDKIIKIEDVDPIIFETFLEYIYTAQVDLNKECMDKAFGLVPVADKYGIEELKAICFRFMIEHMSLKNAGDIAVLTYQHNAGERIRSNIVNFCHTNWSELAKLSAFEECVSESPLAFFKDKQSSTK